MNSPNEIITIPLKDLIWLLLGDEVSGYPNARIPLLTADVLAISLKDSNLYHLQLEDHDGIPLPMPILWRMRDWLSSDDKHKKQKAYSDKIRVESFIRKSNEENVTRLLCQEFGFDINNAPLLASKLVRISSVTGLKERGLKKVITKEEEL